MNQNRKFRKRVVQSTAVALMLFTMTGVAAVNVPAAAEAKEAGTVATTEHTTAGIISLKSGMQLKAIQSASVSKTETTEVASTMTTAATTATETTAVNSDWISKLTTTTDGINIRSSASETDAVVGKLRNGDVATITATQDGWYQITSGNVSGYVKAEYCVTGDAAKAAADQVHADGAYGQAISLADYQAAIVSENQAKAEAAEAAAAKKAAAAKAKTAATQKTTTTVTQKEAQEASYDDVTLLAALIQCEAGSGNYDGQLAVGSVVMNRVRSGGYPNSIYAVIYQSGQFPPAASGKVAKVASQGPSASARKAAEDAIAGTDNTNGATGFCSARTGKSGTVIGGNIFY